MNLGAEPWRKHLEGRIADMIERYGVDAYFLDIVGGHVNSTTGDMHEGTRRLVEDLRAKYPKVAVRRRDAVRRAARIHPDVSRRRRAALAEVHAVLPASERAGAGPRHRAACTNRDSDDSTPRRWSLSPNAIPTLQVVDDTFTKYRDVMAAIIAAGEARGRGSRDAAS